MGTGLVNGFVDDQPGKGESGLGENALRAPGACFVDMGAEDAEDAEVKLKIGWACGFDVPLAVPNDIIGEDGPALLKTEGVERTLPFLLGISMSKLARLLGFGMKLENACECSGPF
jgi:hypothetical protein